MGGADLTLEQRYEQVGVRRRLPRQRRGAGDRRAPRRASQRARGRRRACATTAIDGCWVMMVGTNDAANIAAGANASAEQRIRSMMDVIGGDPVLWVDTVDAAHRRRLPQRVDAGVEPGAVPGTRRLPQRARVPTGTTSCSRSGSATTACTTRSRAVPSAPPSPPPPCWRLSPRHPTDQVRERSGAAPASSAEPAATPPRRRPPRRTRDGCARRHG